MSNAGAETRAALSTSISSDWVDDQYPWFNSFVNSGGLTLFLQYSVFKTQITYFLPLTPHDHLAGSNFYLAAFLARICS
jgi:hypothetical protein